MVIFVVLQINKITIIVKDTVTLQENNMEIIYVTPNQENSSVLSLIQVYSLLSARARRQ